MSWDNFVASGRSDENFVKALLLHYFPNIQVVESTSEDDINKHVDLWCTDRFGCKAKAPPATGR